MNLVKLYLYIILLFPALTQAQEVFYSRYEGFVGSSRAVMHLNRMEQSTEACLYVFGSAAEEDVRQFTLLGTMGEKGDVSFHEPASDEELLSGRLTQNRFEGIWHQADGIMQRIYFTDTYPAGSHRFSLFSKNVTIPLFEEDNAAEATFEIDLLWPEDQQDTLLTRIISSWMNPAEDSISSNTLSADALLDHEFDQFASTYKQMSRFDKNDSPALFWIKSEQQQVLINEFDLLCIESASYVYTGGAHGMENFRFLLIDLAAGSTISKENLFLAEKESLLSQLITNTFRVQNGVPTEQSLTAFGLFTDTIRANDNIFMNYSGIGFYYNSYEIAPYAFGHSSVLIPYEALFPVMSDYGKTLSQKLLHYKLSQNHSE